MKSKLIAVLLVCMMLFVSACSSDDNNSSSSSSSSERVTAERSDSNDNTSSERGDSGSESSGTKTASNKSAYEQYMELMSVMSAQPDEDSQIDMDMNISMDMVMSMLGETESMKMNMGGNIKMIIEDGILQYAAVIDMGDMFNTGVSSVMEMYYDNGRSYYAVDGYETPMSEAEILEQIYGTADAPEFSESAIKSVDTKTVGGNEEITIIIDGNELTDYIMEAVGPEMAELGAESDISVRDVVLVLTQKPDGTPVAMRMEMFMDMALDMSDLGLGDMSIDVKLDMIMEYVINKYGSGVEIDFSKLG